MDEATLDLFRRIFDELLDNPLPDTITSRNAATIIAVLIDSMAMAGQGTKQADKSDFIPTPPKPKPIPPMSAAVMRNQLAALSARAERLGQEHRAANLQSRVNELLGSRKQK